MRRAAAGDDEAVLRGLLQEDGAVVCGEAAGVGLALPEMRAVHVEPFHLLGVDVEALRGFGDQLLAGLEAIAQFARGEFTELDTPAANLLTNRDYRHVGPLSHLRFVIAKRANQPAMESEARCR